MQDSFMSHHIYQNHILGMLKLLKKKDLIFYGIDLIKEVKQTKH